VFYFVVLKQKKHVFFLKKNICFKTSSHLYISVLLYSNAGKINNLHIQAVHCTGNHCVSSVCNPATRQDTRVKKNPVFYSPIHFFLDFIGFWALLGV